VSDRPPDLQPEDARRARRFAVGVLALCSMLGFVGRGLTESFLVFLLPLSAEFGGERASVTIIYSTALLLSGISAPLVGHVFDRLGPRVLYATGLLFISAGLFAASRATAIWHLQLCLGIGLGFGAAALGNVPNATLVARWFVARQSLVNSVVFSSLGFGILLLVPTSQALIDAFGWRKAYLLLAAAAAVVLAGIMLLPWQRIRRGHPALAPDMARRGASQRFWTFGRVLRHPAFWGLFAVFFFTSQGVFSVTVQAVAFLVEQGYSPIVAASAWGFTGVIMPLGMIAFGWLDDRIGRKASVTLSYFMTFAGVATMWAIQHWPGVALLFLFIFLMGSTLGSRGPLVASIAMRIFKGPNAGAIFGAISLGGGIGSAFGSTWGGYVHDATGGYGWVMALAAMSLCFGMSPFWLVRALRRDEPAPAR